MAFEFKNSKGVSYFLHSKEVLLKGETGTILAAVLGRLALLRKRRIPI